MTVGEWYSHRVRGGGPSIFERSAGFRSVASIIVALVECICMFVV